MKTTQVNVVVPFGEAEEYPFCRFTPDTMKVMKNASKTFSYSVFYEQAAEGGYVGFVPALPGCHTQGETLEETERNVKEAIALYLECLAAHGEPIPEEGRSFQGRVTVPVPAPA
jgi:predicted RNase H-like HicB family nuclease